MSRTEKGDIGRYFSNNDRELAPACPRREKSRSSSASRNIIFLIRNIETNSILFIGQVMDPSEG